MISTQGAPLAASLHAPRPHPTPSALPCFLGLALYLSIDLSVCWCIGFCLGIGTSTYWLFQGRTGWQGRCLCWCFWLRDMLTVAPPQTPTSPASSSTFLDTLPLSAGCYPSSPGPYASCQPLTVWHKELEGLASCWPLPAHLFLRHPLHPQKSHLTDKC